MTTATPMPLANRPQEQHDMPQPTATAVAAVLGDEPGEEPTP
jgi:hypothetical protein